VVLIGILSALIVPEMKGTFEDALLRSTSRKLVDAFSLASSQAVALGQVCRFHLDAHTGRFELEKRVRRGGVEDFIPLKDLAGSEGTLDSRISIQIRETEPTPGDGDDADVAAEPAPPALDASVSPDNESILFNADGTADSREISLHDRTGFGLVLRLNPITAGIRVRELPHE
jgi:hypothetical protein